MRLKRNISDAESRGHQFPMNWLICWLKVAVIKLAFRYERLKNNRLSPSCPAPSPIWERHRLSPPRSFLNVRCLIQCALVFPKNTLPLEACFHGKGQRR